MTFLEAVLAGEVANPGEQIHEWVARWHEGEGDGCSLRAFLGLSEKEYAEWATDDGALDRILRERGFRLLKTKADLEEAYGGKMKRYPLPERFVGPSEYTAKLSDQIRIETVEGQRTLASDKWKVTIEKGSPLLTLDGEERITELEEGMEVLAPTLFGYIRGRARKINDKWDVEGEETVALVEWDDKRKCYVSESAYNKASAEELMKGMTE